jgi:hypothetical protein
MKAHRIHARDVIILHNQKWTTAICGMRPRAELTIYAPLIPRVHKSEVTCVGCRAILRAREQEAVLQRAETPVRHETENTGNSK